MPRPALGWLALLLLAARPAAAAPVAPEDYFPLVPGTSWTYVDGGSTQTRQVQPPSPPGSSLRVVRAVGEAQQSTYEATAAGVLLHSRVGDDGTLTVFSPPIALLPASVDVGNSGSQNGAVAIGPTGLAGTYSYAWQVTSIGPQTTPLGAACDVLQFSWTFSLSFMGDTTTDHAANRLVRGLGLVRSSGDVDGVAYDEQLTASSLPFPLDTDCDGIRDDGNLSGTAGDLPCAAPLLQLCDDNCRNTPNSGQTDSGGLNGGAANGIGDACECGDGSNDGRVNLVDAVRLARQLAGRSPGVVAPQKCHVLPFGPCDGSHLLRLRQAIAGNPLGVIEACPAYTGVFLP